MASRSLSSYSLNFFSTSASSILRLVSEIRREKQRFSKKLYTYINQTYSFLGGLAPHELSSPRSVPPLRLVSARMQSEADLDGRYQLVAGLQMVRLWAAVPE